MKLARGTFAPRDLYRCLGSGFERKRPKRGWLLAVARLRRTPHPGVVGPFGGDSLGIGRCVALCLDDVLKLALLKAYSELADSP